METLPEILKAIQFATVAHAGQVRGGGKGVPYVTHVLDVARRLSEVGFNNSDTLIAAILHDTVEDTQVTDADIRREFGLRVANLVADLTLPKEIGKDYQAKQAFQMRKMRDMDLHGQAIKIADKTSNVFDLMGDPPKWSLKAIRGYSDSARELVFVVTQGDDSLLARVGLDLRMSNLVTAFEDTYRAVADHYGWEAPPRRVGPTPP